MAPFLQLKNLTKGYAGTPVLNDVNLSVAEGEFVAILGFSGTGKTTLISLIAGLIEADSGEVLIKGQPVSGPGGETSLVFQSYSLFPWLTVERNVAFGLDMKDVPAAQKREIVEQHIRLVGLTGFERHLPHQLSGGMRQRVAIARALAVDPKVALFDEPFAALDAQNRALLQDELVRISQATHKTMLLITHSIDEAVKLSDRVIVMTARPGRVKENVVIDLPKPRDENDPAVVAMKARIKRLIVEEAAAGMA